jgi:hypothetical protein
VSTRPLASKGVVDLKKMQIAPNLQIILFHTAGLARFVSEIVQSPAQLFFILIN